MTGVVPTDLARALGERYELRDVLGRGGMATVYIAYDRKHHRDVALKVMRPDIAATIEVLEITGREQAPGVNSDGQVAKVVRVVSTVEYFLRD